MSGHRLIVGPDGGVRFLYADELCELAERLGPAVTRRASHVEPDPDGSGWVVDLTPSGGPGRLGPFRLRGEALAAEAAWLVEHGLPTPGVGDAGDP